MTFLVLFIQFSHNRNSSSDRSEPTERADRTSRQNEPRVSQDPHCELGCTFRRLQTKKEDVRLFSCCSAVSDAFNKRHTLFSLVNCDWMYSSRERERKRGRCVTVSPSLKSDCDDDST